MIRKSRVMHTFKGKIVDSKFVEKNRDFIHNQPPYIIVIQELSKIEALTDEDKMSYLLIDENGNMTTKLNIPIPVV